MAEHFFPRLGLGLMLWHGVFENKEDSFLRWCDRAGKLLPIADENRAQAEERAVLLAAKLQELSIDTGQL